MVQKVPFSIAKLPLGFSGISSYARSYYLKVFYGFRFLKRQVPVLSTCNEMTDDGVT